MSEKGIALKWPDSNALRLMSTQELAEALGVDVKTIRRNAQKLGFSGDFCSEPTGGRSTARQRAPLKQ